MAVELLLAEACDLSEDSVMEVIHFIRAIKEPLINSAAHLTVPFSTSATCRFLDLPPVDLRNLQLHLSKLQ